MNMNKLCDFQVFEGMNFGESTAIEVIMQGERKYCVLCMKKVEWIDCAFDQISWQIGDAGIFYSNYYENKQDRREEHITEKFLGCLYRNDLLSLVIVGL